jgi:hypothetical protein
VYEFERDGDIVREPVERQRVRSLITSPVDGGEVDAGEVVVRGVAWSGAGPVACVEVSVDGGAWRPADLTGDDGGTGWQEWQLTVRLDGPATLRARATDRAGATQPERPVANRFGYGGNAIHEVRVNLA